MVEDFLGQYLAKIDDKKRIILPSKSGVTKGEQFIIVNTELKSENVLRLYGKVQYFEILKRYSELRDKAKTEEEYLRLSQKMDEIYLSIERVIEISNNRRIILPASSINHCGLEDYARVIGMGDSILIRKPKNAR